MNGWKVQVQQDADSFVRDRLTVYMAYRDDEGIRFVKPINWDLGDQLVKPEEVHSRNVLPMEPTYMPKELAERLFENLGYHLLGVGEPLREIQRLRAELSKANSRVDRLIEGIGRLGESTNRS